MESSRYLSCLRHDAARLREVASERLDDAVPSCPGWTVADLVTHVGAVYLHKIKSIQLGEFPRPWPPDFSGEQPLALLDRSLAELLDEFDKHEPTDPAKTWHAPDQSVGFWIRRMAQETVIHRVDAELAAGDVTAMPNDLALDGIDEVLSIFLGRNSLDTIGQKGPDPWPALAAADGQAVEVRAGDRVWSVCPTPAGVEAAAQPVSDPAAVISGDPAAVLLWLWRRGDDSALSIAGDPKRVSYLHQLMESATQ